MDLTDWFERNLGLESETQIKIAWMILIFVVLYVIKGLVVRFIFKKVTDIKDRYFWKHSVRNIYYVLLTVSIGFIWLENIGSVATFLGLVTAGLAIALQDPVVNLAGWFFILIRRPFEVGDRIEIGGIAGDVIDIRFFQFTINEINNWVDADQSTGRVVHIPNGQVFREPQANYTQGFGFIWNEIAVLITFESDWKRAKEILNAIIREHSEKFSKKAERELIENSKKFMIFYTKLSPIVYTSVKDSGVLLTMRYLVNPRNRRITEHHIWEAVLDQFAREKSIDLAYPTQRIYFDGK